jgi:hypothetical protein
VPVNRVSTPKLTSPAPNTAAKAPKAATTASPANATWGAGPKLPTVATQIRELGAIAFAAKQGTLNPQQVEAKLAKLTPVSSAEGDVLWSAAGASKRPEFIAAYQELAKAAPNAHMPANPVNGHRATTAESVLQLQFTDAQASRDGAKMKALAKEFAKQFPNSPSNQWVQNIAARS